MSAYSHLDNILFVSSHELGRPSQPKQNRERQIRELQEENKKLQQQQKECERQIRDLQQQLNGNVYAHPVSPENCYATGKGLEEATVGEQTIAVMHVIDEEGSEYDKPLDNMKCKLLSEANGTVVKCKVEKKDSHYEISYQPTHMGKHQLSIRIGGVHIRGSPFSVVVKAPVPSRQRDLFRISLVMFLIVMATLTAVVMKFPTGRLVTPIRIIDGVSLPKGMAVRDNGEIVVAEDGSHSVSIFAHNGKKIRTFGTKGSNEGQFNRPSGVAFDSAGNILVVDGYNHRIQKFTARDLEAKAVGSSGNGDLQFNYPTGIGVNHKNHKVYVCDSGNHRVQILNEDLTSNRSFGHFGCCDGEFHYPVAVAFDSTGCVYVVGRSSSHIHAHSCNHRIQVFTPEGRFLRKFGKEGSGEGELDIPLSIGIDSNDLVYVSDMQNHRVSVFTSQGKFIQSFGTKGKRPGEFNQPRGGIAVDTNGLVYVSDTDNDRVQIFCMATSC